MFLVFISSQTKTLYPRRAWRHLLNILKIVKASLLSFPVLNQLSYKLEQTEDQNVWEEGKQTKYVPCCSHTFSHLCVHWLSISTDSINMYKASRG